MDDKQLAELNEYLSKLTGETTPEREIISRFWEVLNQNFTYEERLIIYKFLNREIEVLETNLDLAEKRIDSFARNILHTVKATATSSGSLNVGQIKKVFRQYGIISED